MTGVLDSTNAVDEDDLDAIVEATLVFRSLRPAIDGGAERNCQYQGIT